jgi:hypothetical protein
MLFRKEKLDRFLFDCTFYSRVGIYKAKCNSCSIGFTKLMNVNTNSVNCKIKYFKPECLSVRYSVQSHIHLS